MRAVEIKPDVYWVGVNDRFTHLFEGFWPIGKEGISYNAYLLKDEKNVLIDLAKSIKTDEFFEQIEEIIPVSKINYVVINHMEPDHTGILTVLKKNSARRGDSYKRKRCKSFEGFLPYRQQGKDCQRSAGDKYREKNFEILLHTLCSLAGNNDDL